MSQTEVEIIWSLCEVRTKIEMYKWIYHYLYEQYELEGSEFTGDTEAGLWGSYSLGLKTFHLKFISMMMINYLCYSIREPANPLWNLFLSINTTKQNTGVSNRKSYLIWKYTQLQISSNYNDSWNNHTRILSHMLAPVLIYNSFQCNRNSAWISRNIQDIIGSA